MAPRPVVAERLKSLMQTPEVGGWYKDYSSPATARTQLDQLELFCRRVGTDPVKLLALARTSLPKLKETVQDFMNGQQAIGRSSHYVINMWWGVRAFLTYHEAAPPGWTPKLKAVRQDEEGGRHGLETVPTQEQLRAILSVLPSRGRAAALLMATSGIRVGVLATQDGPSDGLRIENLPDLRLTPEPRFETTPFMVHVPSYLAKGSTATKPRGYITFGTSEAAEAIVAYLKERRSRGETLTPKSLLIAPDGRGRTSGRTTTDGARVMARKTLAFSIRRAMDRVKPANVHWHAHTLRAWFSDRMEDAESHGLVSATRREYFMGHGGKVVDFDYNLNKPKTAAKVAELRASYQRCEPFLFTIPTKSAQDTQANIAKVMLLGLGYTEEELADKDLLDPQVFQQMVKDKMVSAAPRQKQKLVEAQELPQYLEDGWTVVTALNGHQVVLNPPS